MVSDLAAAEAYHALQHHYGMPEAETRALLRSFLTSGVVHLDPQEAVREFQPAPGAGLLDRLIHARYRSAGATTLTLDRGQGRLEGAVLLGT
jgi:predicted nucleic acid-binding protein